MECKVVDYDKPSANGWRRVQCVRCAEIYPATPDPPEMFHANCKGFPRWKEFGHWFAFWLGVFGLDKKTWAKIRRLLGIKGLCGCQQREQAMNASGEYCAAIAARFWLWLRGAKR